MILSSVNLGLASIVTIYLMTAMWHCNCGKDECLKNPRTETSGIYFNLKDSITGNDIISLSSGSLPVPDTIKLIDFRTGFSYPLYAAASVNETVVFSQHYQRPASIIDTLVFKFGNAIPDTLIVYTGVIDGWRGDECPSVKEPGITKVVLRGRVLIETSNDQATFTLKK